MKSSTRAVRATLKAPPRARTPAPAEGTWSAGVAMGATGMRRFRLYRPPRRQVGERLPLLVMLHGCGQDALAFAASTRMNRMALRERFLVLYPEQDRLANAQGCWNWFDTASGRAQGEAALIMAAIDQVCHLHPVDPARVVIAGLSAGASMAALLATQHPDRFRAVVMHSGVPPGTAHSTLSAWGAMRGRRATKPLVVAPHAAQWPTLLVIHGQADAVVSPQNGRACAQVWADGVGAQAALPRRIQRGQRYAMSVTDFKRQGATLVSLIEVDKLAHAWSGGAASQPYSDPRGPDASRMVWSFAARQFRGV
jgi:poly(hydroxyalkanoate) depolymerase family esterase